MAKNATDCTCRRSYVVAAGGRTTDRNGRLIQLLHRQWQTALKREGDSERERRRQLEKQPRQRQRELTNDASTQLRCAALLGSTALLPLPEKSKVESAILSLLFYIYNKSEKPQQEQQKS